MKYVVEYILWFVLAFLWVLIYALIALLAFAWYLEWKKSVNDMFGAGLKRIGDWMDSVFHKKWRFTVEDREEIRPGD